MGLKKIVDVRQFTDFTKAGKLQRMYEVTFTTEKTAREFSFNIPQVEYTAEKAKSLATQMADQIDGSMI